MRNLIRETNAGTTGWQWISQSGTANVEEVSYQGVLGVKLTRVTGPGTYQYISKSNVVLGGLKPSTDYVLSMDIKQSNPSSFSSSIRAGNYSQPFTNKVPMANPGTTDWVHFDIPLKTVDVLPISAGQILYLNDFPATEGTEVCIANVALYEGTIPQPWTPAPEDVLLSSIPESILEPGAISTGNTVVAGQTLGNMKSSDSSWMTIRVRTKNIIPLLGNRAFYINFPANLVCFPIYFDSSDLSVAAPCDAHTTKDVFIAPQGAVGVELVFKKSDNSEITPADVTSVTPGGGYSMATLARQSIQLDRNLNPLIDDWTSGAIKDGVTKINGGYIQTQTINSSHLIVEDIFATGSAAMNIISARELNADLITSGTINANFLSLYGMKVLNKTTNQETLNITDGGEITLRGSVESYNFNTGKTGWAIKHDGDAEFNDVVVRGSVITNDGGIVSSGGSGRNLLLNSYSDKKNSNASYPCAIYNLAKKVTADEKYTFTIRAEFTNSLRIALSFGGGVYGSQWVSVPGDGTHTISFTFTADANKAAQSFVHVYVRDQANSASFTNGSCKIIWAKLEEGTVATAWSPAPEDNLKQVRFWAGASYDEREAAPWIVYNDGSMVATKGTFSGVFSGDIKIGNISITDPSNTTGNDAVLTVTNGTTGVEAIQLTDRSTSVFRQSVVFRSASAESTDTTISLEPNGTGIFKSSVQVGSGANVAGLENDKLVIRGHTLTHNSSGLQSNSDFFVGEAAHKKNLKTYGDMYATGVVRTDDMVLFANKAQMKIVANGLNIDVFNS